MTSRGGGRGAARGGEFLKLCGAGWRPVDLPHKDLWPLITGARSLSRSYNQKEKWTHSLLLGKATAGGGFHEPIHQGWTSSRITSPWLPLSLGR